MTPSRPDAAAPAGPVRAGFAGADTAAAVAATVPASPAAGRERAGAPPGVGPVRTVAVAGAKGGVGRSTVAANLAAALGRAGHRTLLFDADLALGSAASLLGTGRRASLADVLAGRAPLDAAVVPGPPGVSVIPSAAPDPALTRLSRIDHASLVALFSDLDTGADTLVVDTPPGLSDAALCPAGAAREVLVVTGPEPADLDGAAALVHAVAARYRADRFRVAVNRARSSEHGLDLFGELGTRVDPGADLLLDHAGTVPDDPYLAEAARRGRPVTEAFPRSPAARAFVRLAARAARWPRPATPAGRIEFFVERLVQAAGPHPVRATTA